jgi:hypothetical protein
MLRCRSTEYGVKPAAGSVSGAVLSSVEVQAPSFHPLNCVIFSLMDCRSQSSVDPRPFRNRRIRPPLTSGDSLAGSLVLRDVGLLRMRCMSSSVK